MKGIDKIAGAIQEGFKLLGQIITGAEKRRMRKAIEVSEKLIRRYEKLYSVGKRDKYISKYIEQFYKYNN